MNQKEKYLSLLSEKYPTKQSICREIINLNAILNLPKGTEHFMSDLHGEYEAFYHIVNNCSGVIREKVKMIFDDRLSPDEQGELCTLIYYPREKLELLERQGRISDDWYRMTLYQLIELARVLSSKYTRSKVRKALPADFAYIIDELIHVQKDEDDNQVLYHQKIMDTILILQNGDEFLIALTGLIKRLAVDHLHIIGDIYDRGPHADKIMDLLMEHHSVDIQWGNHDVLWMGAACGNPVCVALVVRNNIHYGSMSILENEYGISLRKLTAFASKFYPDTDITDASYQAISIILFKLEGQLIKRHPEYKMEDRLLLESINLADATIEIQGKKCQMVRNDFPTLDMGNPYELISEETDVIESLVADFINSTSLKRHMDFLYEKGSMYKIHNGNLLFHGCVPLDKEGNFDGIAFENTMYKGRAYLDFADMAVRKAREGDEQAKDFMWYLWAGIKSPLSGRHIKTFEKTYLDEEKYTEETNEQRNPYYEYYSEERVCNMILREFDLYGEHSHIINGHTPVIKKEGQLPIRANGKLIVIDGGFSEKYHNTTGIAGYTLIYNSHGLRLKEHQPFDSVDAAIRRNVDIDSDSQIVEISSHRVMVKDADNGKEIAEEIADLMELLQWRKS